MMSVFVFFALPFVGLAVGYLIPRRKTSARGSVYDIDFAKVNTGDRS